METDLEQTIGQKSEQSIEESIAQLLCLALERPVTKEQVNLFSDIGNYKFIYSVSTSDENNVLSDENRPNMEDVDYNDYLAVAVPRETPIGEEEYDLLEEFRLLKLFYREAEDFFPKPGIYIESDTHRIFTMELLPQRRIRKVKPELDDRELGEVVWQIGYAMGVTYGRTGYFTEEPHDDNILVEHDGDPIVKLIDTAHFIEGSKEELIQYAYKFQDICEVYEAEFLEGLENGMNEA